MQASANRYESMRYSRSGKSGLQLPKVSLGLWHNFGTKDSYEQMVKMCQGAFDSGITHFDLANNYGPIPGSAEENFGRIMRESMHSYRDEMIISTKAGYTMWDGPYGDWGSRKYLLASLDQSLNRMGLDYVDIFYHHRMDPNTPLEESMGALASAVAQGKALYAGISNYNWETAKRAMEIMEDLKCPLIINQIRYSMFDRWIERDELKLRARAAGLGLISFSPLAQGMLTNRYLDGIPKDARVNREGAFLKKEDISMEQIQKVRRLNELAMERGQSLAQMALAWVVRDEDVTSVIIGASKPEQIKDNVGMLSNTSFSEDELEKIDEICRG